jgi:hypothetical protein
MHDRNLETAHPDAPWMWRRDWVEGRIRGHSRSVTVLSWVMAVLWNGFMWPVLLVLWGEPDKRIMVKVIVIFCLVGLGILLWAIKNTLGWIRFGTSVFELASNPGVIGGPLEGSIQTRLKRRPKAPIQVTLSCARRVTGETDEKGGTSVATKLLWQGGCKVSPELLTEGARGLSIPVHIQIPADLKSTDLSDPNDQTLWTLGVSADLPGVNFDTNFTVPVFVTDDSDPGLTQERIDEETKEEGGFTQPADRDTSWAPPVSVRWTRKGGVEYTFRIAVPLKAAVGASLLTVAVCAGSALLWVWLEEAGPFALLPGALGALLLLATVTIWTFTSRVLVERGTVSIRKSVLWIPRTSRVPFSDIKGVRVKREVLEGVKTEDSDWELKIERYSEDEEVDLGASIPDRAEAVRIAEEMGRLIL